MGQDENKNDQGGYEKNKWKKIMNVTQSNYANMLKRLTRKSKVSNFVLIYYSIFLIISSLTCKYFPERFNTGLADYFNIILSVIVLAYSLINNNANYDIRIIHIERSLNSIKNLKRKINDTSLQTFIDEYNEITDKTERRDDIDFFITVRQLKKKYKKEEDPEEAKEGENAVNDYLSEINVLYQGLMIGLEYIWYIILILIPVIVFILCIITKSKSQLS